MNTEAKGRWRRVGEFLAGLEPLRLLVFGCATYIVVGWLLLCLPICQSAAGVGVLDNLFTATSAVSTTGLVTVSAADDYNFLGQLVILLLIQLGGLSYMAISSLLVLSVQGEISMFRRRIATMTSELPTGFDWHGFLRRLITFALVIEFCGAVALYPAFHGHGVAHAVWMAVLHSVSAFCTAGFRLFNNSFETYRGHVWLNMVIMVISYLGAIGFIVFEDVRKYLSGRIPRISVTTKMILATLLWVTVAGTFLLALDEPTIHALPPGERWLTAFFQIGSAATTVGFTTVPIGGLAASSVFLLTVIMIIGASPSGTGGGLKTTNIATLWAVMKSVLDRQDRIQLLGRELPLSRVRVAVANLVFYLLILTIGIYLLEMVETAPFGDQVFECASALGTVGLSRGITSSLTGIGKLIIIALMFAGRVGPLALGFAVFHASPPRPTVAPNGNDSRP